MASHHTIVKVLRSKILTSNPGHEAQNEILVAKESKSLYLVVESFHLLQGRFIFSLYIHLHPTRTETFFTTSSSSFECVSQHLVLPLFPMPWVYTFTTISNALGLHLHNNFVFLILHSMSTEMWKIYDLHLLDPSFHVRVKKQWT